MFSRTCYHDRRLRNNCTNLTSSEKTKIHHLSLVANRTKVTSCETGTASSANASCPANIVPAFIVCTGVTRNCTHIAAVKILEFISFSLLNGIKDTSIVAAKCCKLEAHRNHTHLLVCDNNYALVDIITVVTA